MTDISKKQQIVMDVRVHAVTMEDALEWAKEAVLEKYKNLGMITGVRNYLNMRKGPSTDYEICGVIFKNCAVEILEEKDGWMKIESGGATGYVSAEYVTTGEKHMN